LLNENVHEVIATMKIPGTTVTLALLPDYVELRDEGRIKKKIPTESKSFEEIVKEVKSYFRFFDKRFPPGHIEDVLRQIGVEVELKRSEKVAMEPGREEPSDLVPEKEVTEYSQESVTHSEKLLKKHRVAGKEVGDISEALAAVESMSDTFRSPKRTQEQKTGSGVQVELNSQTEIMASSASLPKQSSIQDEAIENKIESEQQEEAIKPEGTGMAKAEEALGAQSVKTSTEEPDIASQHMIKPLVDKKCLLVGEENVGKKSLIKAAGLETSEEDYIYKKMFRTDNLRVNLHVWSFDDAVRHRIPRNEYYGDADVAILVYSTCDRWSFESLNFWIKELSISREIMPPLIIAGNKYDKKVEQRPDKSDESVTEEEGFKYAEKLATELGEKKDFHPVAFLETSCVETKNIKKLFQIAAELSVSDE